MNKFQVKSINDMLYAYPNLGKHYSFKEGDIQVIVITTNKYRYNFKPLLILDFDDISKDYQPQGARKIKKRHINEIHKVLPEIEKAYLVFVCCDAGISRSPAIAKALSHYLHDVESYNHLAYQYPFANSMVFEFALLNLRKSRARFENEYTKGEL